MRKITTPLTKNFITPRLQGRTGNMMFQIANAYVQALRHNRQLVIPRSESSSGHLEKTLFRKLDFLIERTSGNELDHIHAPFHFEELSPSQHRPTVFVGWYQSEKYFGNYGEVIKDLYSPTPEFINRVLNEFPFFNTDTVAAINVRRGDYLEQSSRHPVVSLEYIYAAVDKLPKYDKILVLSDDIAWCRENIKLENCIFVDNYWDCDGLWLLSLCDHFVISNSTFSWWGAYLSRTENKVVVAPDTWFGPDIIENTNDLYCEGWIRLPTYYENGYILPHNKVEEKRTDTQTPERIVSPVISSTNTFIGKYELNPIEFVIHNYHDNTPATFTGYEHCHVSYELFQGNIWEEYLHKVFEKYVTKDSVVLDIGAHIGAHTVKLSKLAGTVYAFEPLKQSNELLRKNLLKNNCHNVVVYKSAVSNMVGVGGFEWVYEESVGAAGLSNNPMGRPGYPGYTVDDSDIYEVQLVTIDSMMLDRLDFIKLDVEGYEELVIGGAIETIKKYKPVIALECWADHYGQVDVEFTKTKFKMLLDIGYDIEHIQGPDFIFYYRQ
jgi:FkbM family methyltransferase